MTKMEKIGSIDFLLDAQNAAFFALEQIKSEMSEVDGRIMAVAKTEIEKGFVMAMHAIHSLPTSEE
jgi:hypothetical protein